MDILVAQVRTRSVSVNIRAERAGLLRALRYADAAAFDVACHLRDAGLHWRAIRAWCKTQKISAFQWAQDKRNSPITKRWLDEHAAFADRFDEFVETWKWAQALPASPTRKPSLHMFMDLMDSKRQHDTYSKARREMYLGKVTRTIVPVLQPERQQSTGPETLTPTTRLIVGDVVAMSRQHVTNDIADVCIADVPYFLREQEHHVVDYYLAINGMKPRFHAHWDHFESVEDYELHAEQWLSRSDGGADCRSLR